LQPERTADDKIVVKNTVIMRGFQFPKGYENYNKETMMAFRKSKTEGFYSVGFNENKALWRDSL
jgi:CRISPR-associated protein Cse1 (CRISPR_cse1)